MGDLRQPLIPRNDWSSLTVPALGEWSPRLSVSVVIPAFNPHRTLPYTLAALAAQTYPDSLLEVLVVDDCSSPPVRLPEVRPSNCRVVRVEDGWGRANACHVGAMAASGDVIHWLDADMVAYAEEVEAQLRWHHLLDYAVVLGDKQFVDPITIFQRSPESVRELIADGRADELFDPTTAEPHKWVERFWSRTDELTTAGPRAQRVHAGATGSVGRSLYLDSGGMDISLRLGEDIDLGHKLAEAGAVFIPDRQARSWHLGRTHVMEQSDRVNRYNDPFHANLVPGTRPKRQKRGRVYEAAYLQVVLPIGLRPDAGQVQACVDSILDATMGDLQVLLVGDRPELGEERTSPLADPEVEWRLLERAYRSDPRVTIVTAVPDGRCPAPWRLWLPSPVFAPSPRTLEAVIDDLERTHHGRRTITLADGTVARMERTAAYSRVRRVLPADVDVELVDRLVEESWGSRTLAGDELGFVPAAEREIERFVIKAKPPMSAEESDRLMRAALSDSAAGGDVLQRQPDQDSQPKPEQPRRRWLGR